MSILAEHDVEYNTVRYLERPPTKEELELLMGLLGIEDPREMARTKEPVYRELSLATASASELLDAIVAHPILLERPIFVLGGRAVIGRPADRVLELL